MEALTDEKIIDFCKEQIQKESDALLRVKSQVDEAYAQACRAILDCKGRVIVT